MSIDTRNRPATTAAAATPAPASAAATISRRSVRRPVTSGNCSVVSKYSLLTVYGFCGLY